MVHAHSVFSHSPLEVIDECFAHVGRVMRPAGWFDFTFDRTEGKEHQVLREDFYYRTETLVALADRHGLDAAFMDDWERATAQAVEDPGHQAAIKPGCAPYPLVIRVLRVRDVRALPKAHLHVHLESTVRPGTIRDLGGKPPRRTRSGASAPSPTSGGGCAACCAPPRTSGASRPSSARTRPLRAPATPR